MMMAEKPVDAFAQSLSRGLVLSVAKKQRELIKKQQEAADPHQAFVRLIRSRGLDEEKESLNRIIKKLRAASGRNELNSDEKDLLDRAHVQFDAIYRQAIALCNTERLTRLDAMHPRVFQRYLDAVKLVHLFGDDQGSLWSAVPFRARAELDMSVLAPKGTPFIGADAQSARHIPRSKVNTQGADDEPGVGILQWDSADVDRVTLELTRYFSSILSKQCKAVEGDAATVFITSSMVPKLGVLCETITAAIQNIQSGATTSLRMEPIKEDFYKRLDQLLGEWLEILKGKTVDKLRSQAELMARFCMEDVENKKKRRGGIDGSPFIDDAACVKVINESVRLSVCEWVRLSASSIASAFSTLKNLQRSAEGLLTDQDPALWQLKRFGEELGVLSREVTVYEKKTSIPPIDARAVLDDACNRAIEADLSVYMTALSKLVNEQVLDETIKDDELLIVVDALCKQLSQTAAQRAGAGSLKNAYSVQCSTEIAKLMDRAEGEGRKYQKWFENILTDLKHKTTQLMKDSSAPSSRAGGSDLITDSDDGGPIAECKDGSAPPLITTAGLSVDAVGVLNLYNSPIDRDTWRSLHTSLVRLVARFSIHADPCLSEGWAIHLAAVDQLTQQYQPDNEGGDTPTLKQLMAKFPSIACCMGLTQLINDHS